MTANELKVTLNHIIDDESYDVVIRSINNPNVEMEVSSILINNANKEIIIEYN